MEQTHGELIHSRISDLCNKRGIKIAELCRITGVNPNSISLLKNDKSRKNLSFKNASSIAAFFGVPVEYIYGEEDVDYQVEKNDLTETQIKLLSFLEGMSPEESKRFVEVVSVLRNAM